MGNSDVQNYPERFTKKGRLISQLKDALGPVLIEHLEDPETTDIDVNPDGKIWVDKISLPKPVEVGSLQPELRTGIIKLVATSLEKEVHSKSPSVGGDLPIYGARFEGLLDCVTDKGSGFSIRKKAFKVYTLKDYVESDIISMEVVVKILAAIDQKENILVAGATGSGKTTFINAIVHQINQRHPNDRIIICEDVDEIQSSAPNTFKQIASRHYPLSECIKTMLRLNPDRVLIGEIRDAEQAQHAFQGWNTGHKGGAFSLHANSALDALQRLEDFSITAFNHKNQRGITRSIDKLIFIKKVKGQRKLTEFYDLKEFSRGKYILTDLLKNEDVNF